MDFHHKEILKRYARMATGRPFAPILLNILITSVCDMRCVNCFFTDELDDNLVLSSRNLPNVMVLEVTETDTVSLIRYKHVILTRKAVSKFEEMLG